VLVDSVGGLDFDLLKAGGAERAAKLGFGQGTRDAAGPCGHVGASGLVHVGVGDHVGDSEAPARP
jgi:hypothetical protein